MLSLHRSFSGSLILLLYCSLAIDWKIGKFRDGGSDDIASFKNFSCEDINSLLVLWVKDFAVDLLHWHYHKALLRLSFDVVFEFVVREQHWCLALQDFMRSFKVGFNLLLRFEQVFSWHLNHVLYLYSTLVNSMVITWFLLNFFLIPSF